MQYGVEGCSGPGTTPAPTPSPACDQPSLTNELCGQYCYEWLNELNDEIWAGTNNGECYCDTEYDPGGDANGQCTVECPESDCPSSDCGCDQPCAGEPSEMCGGAWFNQIVKVSCGGWEWAWPFVYGIAGLSVGYLVLGTALNMSTGKNELPNAGFWRLLGGLVNDGLQGRGETRAILIAFAVVADVVSSSATSTCEFRFLNPDQPWFLAQV